MVQTQSASVPAAVRPPVIDCDIHCTVPSVEALFPYLSDHWREYCSQSAFRGPVDTIYPTGAPTSVRPDYQLADGKPAGSNVDLLRQHTLDSWQADFGILNCLYGVDSVHNPDTAAALAAATNDWLIDQWLPSDRRFRASMIVAPQQPEMAAHEIDRVGSHPGIIQVLLPIHSRVLYGDRHYHPIYEAAARHDLVIGLHFGGAPGNPPSPSGWPSYYVEEYAGMSQIFQSQVMNIIVEGVFDRFPSLRMVLIESGVTWLPAFLWRFDKEWKGLRRETPWNRMLPSEYVRQHMRLTTQPLDAPDDPRQLLETIEQLGSEDLLLFSTDYPHYHFDTPDEAFPPQIPADLARKILAENARAFYRLPGSPA